MKKKTMMGRLSSLLFALALVWGGVSCTPPQAPVDPTKYTITFDSNGGSEVAAQEVKENVAATAPEEPTKDGYTFVEWLKGETAYDWTAPVTGDLTLTAKWVVEKYTIDYKLPKDSTNDESNLVEYTIESETISELKDPKLPEGFTFLGWYTDENCTEEFVSIEKGSTGDVVIYAKYTDKQTFTVTYYIGDKANTKLEEKDAVFTLTGYNLFTDKECTKAYKDPITSDITLYAEPKTFTISYKVLPFNEEDSLPNISYGKVFTDEEINALAEEIDGYTYKGIFTDEACTVPFDNTNAITSDLTVYVLYEEVVEETPEITYDVVTVDGNVKTIERPTFVSIWGCTVKGNVISYNTQYGEAQWTCEDILNYDKIEIYYENQTEENQLCIKSSSGTVANDRKDLSISDDKRYPNLSVGEGKLEYYISDFVAANENFKYVDLSTCNTSENSVTIIKIVLTKVEKLDDKVIFDPVTTEFVPKDESTPIPEYEIVERDGKSYMKITPSGYSTQLILKTPIDISGYTHCKVEIYNDETSSEWKAVAGLRDFSGAQDATLEPANPETEASEDIKEIECVISGKSITVIQPFTQSTVDWSALSDKVVYIGKITAITK